MTVAKNLVVTHHVDSVVQDVDGNVKATKVLIEGIEDNIGATKELVHEIDGNITVTQELIHGVDDNIKEVNYNVITTKDGL